MKVSTEDGPRNIPSELRDLPQWVDHRDKVPYSARTKRKARTNDPTSWSTFDEAIQASANFHGVGFVFSEDDGYAGVDLDHVIDPESGDIEPFAVKIIEELASYTEVSPSGTGIHIIVRGVLPGGGRKKGQVEVYDRGRYFTMTGQVWDDAHRTVEDRQQELVALWETLAGKSDRPGKVSRVTTDEWLQQHDEGDRHVTLTRLVGSDVHAGVPEEVVRRNAHLWNRTQNPPLLQAEVDSIVDSIWRKDRALGALKLLPFEVKCLHQYGHAEASYVLELHDGQRIEMGGTDALLSGRRSRQRLYEVGLTLSKEAVRHWDEIVDAMQALKTIHETATGQEALTAMVVDWLESTFGVHATTDDLRSELQGMDHWAALIRSDGTAWIRLEPLVTWMRMHRHDSRVTVEGISKRLAAIGFKKIGKVRYASGERQANAWESPQGFMNEASGTTHVDAWNRGLRRFA